MDRVSGISDLLETMATLRGPGGCPWDVEQDHQSIAQCLIDECSELLETIDTLDMEHMREELGDVLLQVVFHSQIAKENGHFDFDAVAAEINEKLVRRHPHVFGDADLETSEEVFERWEQIKAEEKKNKPQQAQVFKNLPPALPAMLYAFEIYKQIRKKELPTGDVFAAGQLNGEAEKLSEEEVGRQLFALSSACRDKGIDPESAVRRYAQKVKMETEALAKEGVS